ncbi:MAG: aminotransferase class I/II-fold pyridoxal phosphate-dependent enzyme [Methylococcales bacterium]|nr:aminotransferase class I/II-fold pyridoxal phosphate-dependent enzyme [Methylococcales bacterium]
MQHGGNIYAFAAQVGCLPEQVLDFSANINPQQAVDVRELLSVSLTPYSDPDYSNLKQAITQRYPIPENADIEVFNGASAAIFALLRYLQPKDVVLYAPLYGEYQRLAERLGCNIHIINRLDSFPRAAWECSGGEPRRASKTHCDNVSRQIPKGSTVIFVNPATPDGTLYNLPDLFAQWTAADCHIIIDESFLDFCTAESAMASLAHYEKLTIIKSLSKFYGCAGIRVGFIAAHAAFIQQLKQLEPAWKLSSLDMAYTQRALANTDFIAQTRQQTDHNRALLQQVLHESGVFAEIYPSAANFLLARVHDDNDGYQLQAQLAPARILIRVCENFIGLDKRFVRFAVKEPAIIEQLAQGVKQL